MDKKMNNENLEKVNNTDNIPEQSILEAMQGDPSTLSVDLFEAAETEEAMSHSAEIAKKTYFPQFTDASENYRLQNDKRIREQLGIGNEVVVEKIVVNPDAISLESTAEFDEDITAAPAKAPENKAEDESDESISVYKFTAEEDEVDSEAAQQELNRINELLRSTPAPAPAAEEPEEEIEEESEVEEVEPQEEPVEEAEPYTMPDPDQSNFGVYDFSSHNNTPEVEDSPAGASDNPDFTRIEGGLIKENEFTNPTQRESFKDKFLDTLLSIRIRLFASVIFGLGLLVLEILSATKVIPVTMFRGSTQNYNLALIDLLLASGVFILSLPETVRAFKYLFRGQPLAELMPTVSYLLLVGYSLSVIFTGVKSYALFGFLFAAVCIPLMIASLYRTKGDFVGFKMISKSEEKQVIDKRSTRELPAENIALDGVVDEYKSESIRTFCAEFISNFFENSARETASAADFGITVGVPFGIGIVAGAVAFFLSTGVAIVNALAVFAIVFMLGCPAFSMLHGKVSFFHTQRAALQYESTAVGEAAYHDFSGADVINFNDTDIFGPDDVNLKRFMLYGDRESMEKVMSQMCALFAAVGGPLDFIFSNVVDNRMRHKTATNLVIENDGISGEVMGRRVFAGTEEYMRRNNIAIPEGATGSDNRFDTTKVMYSAEDGEVNAKFYIRYSFSEEFTMILPELREQGITPLIYTRDPNISSELLRNLSAAGYDYMRVCRLYTPIKEEKVYSRVGAGLITYGDKIDAASTVLLTRKFKGFFLRAKFAELCAMIIGVVLAILLAIVGMKGAATAIAALWQIVWYLLIRGLSYRVFLREAKKDQD